MGISILRSAATVPGPAAPLDIAAAAAVGTGVLSAREDHVHRGLTAAAPVDVGTAAAAVGTALLAARADHLHKIADTGWQVPAYQNGWVDYDATYGPVRYRRIAGITFIRGLAKNGTAGAVIFTLPVGYRPGIKLLFAVDVNANAHGRLDVDSAGQVIHVSGNTGYYQVTCCFVAEL